MKNNEMKVAEAINKDMGYMAGSEIINNQISVIISEINKKVKVNTNADDVVKLSEELRGLVFLRAEIEKQEEIKRIRKYTATENTNEILEKLGIQVFASNGEFLGIENILDQMSKVFLGLTQEEKREMYL